MANIDDDGRELPTFDNHYSDATLIDRWADHRCDHDTLSGKPLPFTLSGASAQQQAADVKLWNGIHTSYQDAFAHAHEKFTPPAMMARPNGLGMELLLGADDTFEFRGVPTSLDYGSHYPPVPLAHVHSRFSIQNQSSGGGKGVSLTPYEESRQRLLREATSSAHQEAGVENLYMSTQRHTFSGKAFADTTGEKKGLVPPPPSLLPDYVPQRDRFCTTRIEGDLPVEYYHFQRRLPPPSIPSSAAL